VTAPPTEIATPYFSIITPVYNTPLDILRTTVASVRAQTYPVWELILVDDHSDDDRVREFLHEQAAEDTRIRVIERETNGHIVVASNDGLAAAQGTFIALLDHDDLLVPRALEHMAAALDSAPDVDYAYSDEDKVDPEGTFFDTFTKASWSPEQLRGHMYTCHFSVLRASVVREVGGFHEGFEGSQDHDLVLRVTEKARRIVHVPKVLYHWRVIPGSAAGDPHAKPYAWTAGVRAVQAHLDRVGIKGTAGYGPGEGTYSITRELDPDVRVSVVMPTAGAGGRVWGESRTYVVDAVRSLAALGGHDNLEIIVVHDADVPDDVLDTVARTPGAHVRLVRYDRPFNFSEKCNLGVLEAQGDVVVLLNDDVEIAKPGFITQLVAPLLEGGVGMTGANLARADGRVQHGGLAIDRRLVHVLSEDRTHLANPFLVNETAGYRVGSALMVNREVSGVSAAALAITRDLYLEVGGLSEDLPVNFGDVDLSFKVRAQGLRLLWIANAAAYHFEPGTRTPEIERAEVRVINRRWNLPFHDQYLPELPESLPRHDPDFQPKPRVAWQ
jgi:O-antigen biosynthesis protein